MTSSAASPSSVDRLATLGNGRAIERTAVPELQSRSSSRPSWTESIADIELWRCSARPSRPRPRCSCIVVLGDDQQSRLRLGRTRVSETDQFASLTPRCPQVHLFEREIAEQFGFTPRDIPGSSRSAFTPRADLATMLGTRRQ